ncbi:MAG: hypothetical protein ACREIT_03600 [Tepidisphaeraceae bacterium]
MEDADITSCGDQLVETLMRPLEKAVVTFVDMQRRAKVYFLCLCLVVSVGCYSTGYADGDFTGPVRAVPVTAGSESRTCYVMTIEQGPEFTRRRGTATWPSTGHSAILSRDRKGTIYDLDKSMQGRALHVHGVLRPTIAKANGYPLSAGEGEALPDYCLQVRRVQLAHVPVKER